MGGAAMPPNPNNTPGARRPSSPVWQRRRNLEPRVLALWDPVCRSRVTELRVYERQLLNGARLRVLSALGVAETPRGTGEIIPQWHVSVARLSGGFTPRIERPDDHELHLVRQSFGLMVAEEDNHHPGDARHLWLPVDDAHRVDCECKTSEVVVVEPDGYTWTNDVQAVEDATRCRACEIAPVVGRACEIHHAP